MGFLIGCIGTLAGGLIGILFSINIQSIQIFIEKILTAGLKKSEVPIKIIKINKKIVYREKEKFISIEPSKLSLDIDFQLKYQNKIIGDQRNKINVYEDDLTEIFNSRTFCLSDSYNDK